MASQVRGNPFKLPPSHRCAASRVLPVWAGQDSVGRRPPASVGVATSAETEVAPCVHAANPSVCSKSAIDRAHSWRMDGRSKLRLLEGADPETARAIRPLIHWA